LIHAKCIALPAPAFQAWRVEDFDGVSPRLRLVLGLVMGLMLPPFAKPA